MDPNYKPSSSLNVLNVILRNPYPRGGMNIAVPTTSGQSPYKPHIY